MSELEKEDLSCTESPTPIEVASALLNEAVVDEDSARLIFRVSVLDR